MAVVEPFRAQRYDPAAAPPELPQKTTYFCPKLISGRLFHPLG